MIFDLLVLGAGAKAAAVTAKIHALNTLQADDRVTALVVERLQPASHWLGDDGFTSGAERLGTRPEKDIGYPYRSRSTFAEEFAGLDEHLQQFSWSTYLRSEGEYSRWIDRGAPAVTHHRFGRYLAWVHAHATRGVSRRTAQVMRIGRVGELWEMESVDARDRVSTALGRALLLTGPGTPRPLDGHATEDTLTAASSRTDLLATVTKNDAHIVVAGGGESAASAAITALSRLGAQGSVSIVAPSYPRERSETYLDNAVFTDPSVSHWQEMPLGERIAFIRRTDRGVVSPPMLKALTSDERVAFVKGRVRTVQKGDSAPLEFQISGPNRTLCADAIVNCTGFDMALQVDRLLDDDARAFVSAGIGQHLSTNALVEAIGPDLSLRGLSSPLFLPALAPLMQGPGFANLSCLGLLADRVVNRLVVEHAHSDHDREPANAVLR